MVQNLTLKKVNNEKAEMDASLIGAGFGACITASSLLVPLGVAGMDALLGGDDYKRALDTTFMFTWPFTLVGAALALANIAGIAKSGMKIGYYKAADAIKNITNHKLSMKL